ncbi:MAG: CDP-alcohol phosphatidyltransferase family protein [Halonotius sp.]
MSNSILPFEVPEAVAAQAERRWDSSVGMGLLNRLTGADYLSLVALFFAWSSALLLLQGDIHQGILAMAGAFCFDKLDGYYARSRGVSSSFGRQVDTFIDIFAYLVTGALLYHVALSPSAWLTLVVGFAILAFGGLRLVRHAEEGFGETDETSYYVGWTVVHVNFVVLAMFYLDLFVVDVSGWLAAVPIILSCPLMISGYKSYKTTAGHILAGLVVVGALISSVLTIAGVL